MASEQTILVTAAIIMQDSQVLITQRQPEDRMGGKWEFPGGKIEPGETPEACLQRELQEELGILTDVHQRFAVNQHIYPHATIELHAYLVTIRSGKLTLHEHQDYRWASMQDLPSFDFCEADLPFVRKLMEEVCNNELFGRISRAFPYC